MMLLTQIFCLPEALIPRNILEGEHLNQMADRSGISYRKETGIVGSILQDSKSVDGAPLDIDQFVLNIKTAHKARQKNRVVQEKKFYDDFIPPKHTAFHWDEKFCKKVLGQDFGQGHIAMLVSGTNYEEGILVGMAGLPNGEGLTVANICYDAMVQCKCLENIRVLVWDTTNSNSGVHKGAAAILERDLLGRKLIWGACRKHVGELLVRPVYKCVFGEPKSADYGDFKEFQKAWVKRPTKDDPLVLDRHAQGQKMKLTTDWEVDRAKTVAQELTKLRHTRNRNNLLPRDDYRELLDLCLLLNPFSDSGANFCAFKPGAYTKARWMCVNIYTMKMYWYKDQEILDYSEEFKAKLDRFCRFLVLVYVPYWFKVPLSSDAAVVDLNMYHLLLKYSAIDSEISNVVLTAQSRHLWYLCPDSIILWSLFGTSLDEDEKSRIAAVLLSKPKPASYEAKKVKFPVLTPVTKIEHLITPTSWFPFKLLGVTDSWLSSPPAQWKQDEAFLEMEEFAHTVKLTNDVAERGVKLIDDYADILTTDSEERKKLVFAVQNHRRLYKKMNKKDLVKRIGEDPAEEDPELLENFEDWADDQDEEADD